REPLPVRVIASYPSWDRFVIAAHRRLGVNSLADVARRQLAVRVSIREDATHSTRVLLDQLLPMYGLELASFTTWGGSQQLNGPPGDRRRLAEITAGSVDLVFDEGIRGWLPTALAHDMQVLELEPDILARMRAIGWRTAVLPRARFPELKQERDVQVIDYSGWPLYTRAALPDDVAYRVCEAIARRAEEIPWEEGTFGGAQTLGDDTEVTPLDVPLHPGAERWYREHRS
ncbi:MAG: hypothetical protein JO057_00235, partial [Chloroflexi bacterium]|nr:hypothetical protein [Chloroflexota bacterium]